MLKKIKNVVNDEDKKRLISNFFFLSLLQGANYILPLLTLPYLLRVLGVEYFGLLAFATATVAYFGILTDYGFSLTVTREISIYRDNKQKIIEIFSSVMIIKVVFLILSFLLLSLLVFSFEKFSKEWLVYFLTFGTIIGQILFPIWLFQGLESMKYITYLNILSRVIFTVTIFLFVKEQNDYYLVPFLTSLGYLITGIWSLFIVRKEFGIVFQFQNWITIKYYLLDGKDIFISRIFSSLYRNSNVIILGFLTNNTVVGYYSVAEKVIQILQSLQDIVGNTLFPYFSKKFDKSKKSFFNINKKFFKFIFASYFSITLVTLVLSGFITFVLLGEKNSMVTLNLQIMSFVILIGGLNYYYGILGLVTMNFKKEFSRYIIITGFFNLIFCYTMVSLYPQIGAAISLLCSEIVLLVLILTKIFKLKKEIYLKEENRH